MNWFQRAIIGSVAGAVSGIVLVVVLAALVWLLAGPHPIEVFMQHERGPRAIWVFVAFFALWDAIEAIVDPQNILRGAK